MEIRNSKVDIVVRALAVFGLASLLGLGIAGIVRVAESSNSNPFSLLASLFSFRRESIVVDASPMSVKSGENVAVHWTHEGKRGSGIYAIQYPCGSGIEFSLTTRELVSCGIQYRLGDVSTVQLTATYHGTSPANIQISVPFYQNGEEKESLSGSVVILVTPTPAETVTPPPPPGKTPPPPPPPAPKTPPPPIKIPIGPNPPPILPNGTPDLAIRIIEIGVLDDAGNFTATSSSKLEQQVGVIFDVTNQGTATSKQWDFFVSLPILDRNTYRSDMQKPLAPGDRIRFTMGFGPLQSKGQNKAIFTIDPENSLKDSNHANDSATATFLRLN